MQTPRNILYIQHAFALGGSVVSLKEVIIDALSRDYHCTIVCPNSTVALIYEKIGAKTIITRIPVFNHNTVFFYRFSLIDSLRFAKMLALTFLAFYKFHSMVRQVRADIVHLNSSNLILYSILFKAMGIPVIYHVRENIVPGYFGVRKWMIRALANNLTTYIFYISEFEFQLLATKPEKSVIIYNYIHEFAIIQEWSVPKELKADSRNLQLIMLGGLFKLKGGLTILESLKFTKDADLLVLGSSDPRTESSELLKIEGREYLNELLSLLKDDRVNQHVKFIGRVDNPFPYIYHSDALIFWAASPHFPRPVFEAWLLNKPVIYHNPSFINDKITSENVLLVKDSSGQELAHCINSAQMENIFTREARERAYRLAKENFTEQNFEKIDAHYQSIGKTQ